MAYNAFNENWIYNNCLVYSFVPQQYFIPTFQCFSTLKPISQLQISQDMDLNEKNVILATKTQFYENRNPEVALNERMQYVQAKKDSEKKNYKKRRNFQKELESAKKNCESNLVNQFLSFFSSVSNSSSIIMKAFKIIKSKSQLIQNFDLEQIVLLFCRQIAIVNSRKERKYVNKAFLQNYYFPEKLEKYMPDILFNVQKSGVLTKNQFCELFRRCCFHFFRNISVSSVTSSAKLNPISRPQHIKRRRIIVQSLAVN